MDYTILDIETELDKELLQSAVDAGVLDLPEKPKASALKAKIKKELKAKAMGYKQQKTVAKYLANLDKDAEARLKKELAKEYAKYNKVVDKQKFNPLFVKINVVTLCQNGEIYQKTAQDNTEEELIKFAYESAIYGKDNLLFTFNGTEFDLPALLSRAEILNVSVDYPEILRRLSHQGRHVDFYRMYKWTQGYGSLSLQLFVRGFGAKQEVDFENDSIETIAKYAWDEMEKFDKWVKHRYLINEEQK